MAENPRTGPPQEEGGAMEQERTPHSRKRDRLLVAVDGSEDRWAGEHALRLAESLGAGLFVLRIVDTHKAFRARLHYARILSELDRETRNVVERIGELATEMGVDYEEQSVRSNHPRRELVRVAEELRPALVVVGARGTSAVDRLWIGNACGGVLKHAGCPVLVVGPEGAPVAGARDNASGYAAGNAPGGGRAST